MSNADPLILAERNLAIKAHVETQPDVQRLPNRNLDLYMVREFLNEEECRLLCDKIDRDARPSTLLSATEDAEFRTSSSTDFNRQDAAIDAIEDKIVAFMGINKDYGETIQGQRYEVGQQFKGHHDWFYDTQDYWKDEKNQGGQRTWTTMVFLDDGMTGGATRFPKIGKMLHPERGKLIAWNNLNAEGQPNTWTLHQGMKVRQGVKHIITKWWREEAWIGSGARNNY